MNGGRAGKNTKVIDMYSLSTRDNELKLECVVLVYFGNAEEDVIEKDLSGGRLGMKVLFIMDVATKIARWISKLKFPVII